MNNMIERAADVLATVRVKSPLVHNITNYVTVNDVANVVLAVGASPIMADSVHEAADIAAIASALVINIGTLNERTVPAMVAAGRSANEHNVPVIFDPVGAGASALRNETVDTILMDVRISIMRGNVSEISHIAGLKANTKGVDASSADLGNDSEAIAQQVARDYQCVVAITGPVDIVSDGETTVHINNGHAMMSHITGTGCMATALIGSLAGAGSDMLAAAVGGLGAMGIAGEYAFETQGQLGTGSFRTALIDTLSKMDADRFRSGVRLS